MAPTRMSISTTRLLRNSTWMALFLAGCQPARQETPPTPAPVPPVAVSAPATDRVAATAEADGRTVLSLSPRPDLHLGDTLHIRDGERVVATALVVDSDEHRTTAWVVALTDRRRPVLVNDRFIPAPTDAHDPAAVPIAAGAATTAPAPVPAPPTDAPAAAAHAAPVPAEPATAPVAEKPSAPVEPAPVTAPAIAEPAHEPERSTAPAATIAEPSPPSHDAATAAPAVQEPAVAETAHPTATDATLAPEVRARLEAERAYWALAARVLRLPAGGPELNALQERLRGELAVEEPHP